MKIAIIGSRSLKVDISEYIPKETTQILSGGAVGIDTAAEKYADEHNIPKLIIRPEYKKYGKFAPLIRNKTIVDNADMVLAFWNGISRGTKYTINYAKQKDKMLKIIMI